MYIYFCSASHALHFYFKTVKNVSFPALQLAAIKRNSNYCSARVCQCKFALNGKEVMVYADKSNYPAPESEHQRMYVHFCLNIIHNIYERSGKRGTLETYMRIVGNLE